MSWDKEHWEYNCSDGKHPSFWKTIVTSPQWKAWYEEVGRRMHVGAHVDGMGWLGEPVFDIDESQECNWISPEHFQEFLKFCKTLKVVRTKKSK